MLSQNLVDQLEYLFGTHEGSILYLFLIKIKKIEFVKLCQRCTRQSPSNS